MPIQEAGPEGLIQHYLRPAQLEIINTIYNRVAPETEGWYPVLVSHIETAVLRGGVRQWIHHWPGVTPNNTWEGQVPPRTLYNGALTERREPSAFPWKFLGCRGICVSDRRKLLTEQDVQLRWAAIDIDGSDNPELTTSIILQRVHATLGNECAMRRSKSGKGLHVFLYLSAPKVMSYSQARACAKELTVPFVRRLNGNGVRCCVSGLPNLWSWGGFNCEASINRPVGHQCPDLQNITTYEPSSRAGTIGTDWDTKFSTVIVALVRQLQEKGILTAPIPCAQQQINVGRVKRALAGLYDLQTRSKGRKEHEGNYNGFIELNPSEGTFTLVSNPDDNRAIMRLHSI
jgi:hypothetical protein